MTQSGEIFPWYALRVKSRYENIIASALMTKGFDVFLPQYLCRRRWSDRVKELQLPLFPGYLFCRLDLMRRLPILMTPGVLHFVGTGKAIFPIDDHEIEALQSVAASRLGVEPWPFLRIGQRVRIEHGPLAGLQGILLSLKKPYRLILSVTLLQRSVAVEIAHDWVTPMESVVPAVPSMTV